MGNKFKGLIKDVLIFAIGNIGSKLILFFLVPFYTNYLSKSEYGTTDLIFTIAQLVLPFVTIVIYDALLRYGFAKDERPEDVLLASVIVLFFGAIVTFLFSGLFTLYDTVAPWRWYLSVYIILNGVYSVNMNYLKVMDKNMAYTVISMLYTAMTASFNILFIAVYKLGVKGFMTAHIVSMSIAILLSMITGKIPSGLRKGRFRKDLMTEMIRYSAPLILNNISWWVVQSSNKILVERFLGLEASGLFTVASKMPALINVLINIFSQAWGISSTKEYEDSNDTGFYSSVLDVYSFICFGVCVALLTIIKPFMGIYVAPEYFEAWKYIPVLLAAATLASIAYYYGSLYGALKKTKNNMVTTLLAAVTNLAVSWFGIKAFGIYGAVAGTFASYLVMSVTRILDVGRYMTIRIDWRRFCLGCLIVIIQALLVSLDFHGFIASCIAIALFVVLYRGMIADLFKIIKKLLTNGKKTFEED